jgi:hypothetical protein
LIGCISRPAELGIPRTQAGRSGSGLGGHRPSSRATSRPSPRRPRSYATALPRHLRHRARPRSRVRCHPVVPRSAPARAGTVHAAGAGATRSSSVALGGLGPPYTLATTRVDGLVPPGPGHGGHTGCSRCAGSPESYRRCRPGLGRLGSCSGGGAYCRVRASGCVSPRVSSLRGRRARSARHETSDATRAARRCIGPP